MKCPEQIQEPSSPTLSPLSPLRILQPNHIPSPHPQSEMWGASREEEEHGASFSGGKKAKTPKSQRTRAFLMKVINIEAGNLVNVTENMGRRRGDLAGLDLKEQKQQEPQ